MTHPFMTDFALGLADRGVATLRYQLPYMERGAKRPDPPRLAEGAVRAAWLEAVRLTRGLPLFAGGKSYGGRMASLAEATSPLPGVRGMIFLGFPLHPAGRPSQDRARHLLDMQVPMLFLQGTRDQLADLQQLRPLISQLGAGVTLKLFQDADHSFHVPARTGRTDQDVRDEMLDAIAAWMALH